MSFRSLCNTALVGLVGVSLGTGALVAAGAGTAEAQQSPSTVSHNISVVGSNGTNFGPITLGDFTVQAFVIHNSGGTTDTISGFGTSAPDPNDFGAFPGANCPTDASDNIVLPAGASCDIDTIFYPGTLGARSTTLTLVDTANSGVSFNLAGVGSIGYYQVSTTGAVAHFGDAAFYGDASGTPLNHPIVGIAQTGDDGGYWLVATDGGIFNYGDAGFFGSAGGLRLNKPIVGMASTVDAGGYWLVASDGGIFSYGDAPFYGSTGSIVLNKPVVGMAPTPDGGGYWLVASDGGIFAYGDAQFYGSTGAIHLNQPINGMAAMPTGNGYWFTAADGGIFNYGDAPFDGSAAGQNLGGPVVAMATDGEPTLQALTHTPAVRRLHGAGASGWASLPGGPRFAGPQ